MKTIWEKWKKIASAIGDFQFNLVFSIIYFVVMVPFGTILNLLNDFLSLKGFPGWQKMERRLETIKDLKEQ